MVEHYRIMAVGAHPDDPEIYCGGTLAKCCKRGDEVFMVYVTDGTAGSLSGDRKKLAATRIKEGRAAAGLINAHVVFLNLPDAELVNSLENRLLMIETIRRIRPDVIITHSPLDQNADHRITSTLVDDANLHAVVSKLQTGSKPTSAMVPIYHMETYLGVGFVPTEYVDISDFFSVKKEMFLAHKSQINYLGETDPAAEGVFPLGWMETVARFRGFQCQVKFAEGFCLRNMGGCLTAKRLLP